MDTMILGYTLLWILLSTCPYSSIGLDAYLCSWPTFEVMQLRCDYVNCPYMSIDHITVGRLNGNIAECSELKVNESTRRPLRSCIYKLTEANDETKEFLMQVKANCTRREICQIYTSSDYLFTSAGQCGYEANQQSMLRNWIHIEYSCSGDVSGEKCIARESTTTSTQRPTTTESTTVAATTEAKTNESSIQPRTPKPGEKVSESSSNHVVQLIIPILATLLFLTLVLIVATVLYRHRIKRNNAWKRAVENRIKHRMERENTANSHKADLSKYKLDSSKLKELEKRLSSNHTKTNNDYLHDMSFSNQAMYRSEEGMNNLNKPRKPRRASLDQQPNISAINTEAGEQYFSDSSVSTTTLEDCDFDSQGRKKKKRMPHPPLPKPVVRHSEVYFTETETESEAPKPHHRGKDVIPKVAPPPKQHRARYERPRQHANKAASTNDISNMASSSNNRNSLDLALTKLAAKKLTAAHEQRSKPSGKKPMARPRSNRPTSDVFGNDTNTYPSGFSNASQEARRAHTLNTNHANNVYRNV